MKALNKTLIAFCLFSALLLGLTAVYAAEGVKVGQLTIKSVPGTTNNLIVQSSVDIEAIFTDTSGNKEYYIGEMGYQLGVDFRMKSEEQLEYIVFSPSTDYKTGSYALQGKYFGQKATAQLGVGAGVQVLLGGLEESFTLQPLALGGTKGFGASYGLGYLFLQKDHTK